MLWGIGGLVVGLALHPVGKWLWSRATMWSMPKE
jgi:hypothetical protein